jgi:hypothetical protein
VLGAVISAPASLAATTDAPTLTLSGKTLSWTPVSGVSSYEVATVRNPTTTRDTTYKVVRATKFAPPSVAGETVNYSVRTYVTGSNWAPEVSITWPAASQVPALTVSGNRLNWQAISGFSSYKVQTIRNPMTTRNTTLQVVNGTSVTPPAVPGETVNYSVRTNVAGSKWAPQVSITWPGTTTTPPPSTPPANTAPPVFPKLQVGVNNSSGWGPALDSQFLNAGIPYERLDIGRGNLSMVDAAISRGMKVLPNYTSGNTGNLNGMTPAMVSSDISALTPQLVSRGITTLEFGNEVYNSISAAQYAALYDAAHVAAAGRIKLLAAATTDYYAQRSGTSGNWFVGMKNALPGGAAEVDGWTIHPYGSMTSLCGDGYGWPMMGSIHDESISAGFSASLPWYVTEVGQQIAGNGLECQAPVSQTVQAADLTQYLNDLKNNYPWVVWIDWYSACDDSSGSFGLVNKNSAGECGVPGTTIRPSFTAMQNWVAANGEG